jgi:hypothetical protein
MFIYKLQGGKIKESRKELWEMIVGEAKERAHNLRFTRLHLFVTKRKLKWDIAVLKHKNYIKVTQNKLNKLSKLLPLDVFIKQSIEEAYDGCTFVIFSSKNNKDTFVQFWTKDKSLFFNFCATPVNKLTKYYKKIIILMEKMGYKQGNFGEINKYELTLRPKEISIDLDFKKDTNKAAELSYRIFKEIYGEMNIKVSVE